MVEVARFTGKRFVHVFNRQYSAIPYPGTVADEMTSHDGQIHVLNVLSKRASEKLVRDAAAQGGGCDDRPSRVHAGPWDWKPSSGRMILEVAKRWDTRGAIRWLLGVRCS